MIDLCLPYYFLFVLHAQTCLWKHHSPSHLANINQAFSVSKSAVNTSPLFGNKQEDFCVCVCVCVHVCVNVCECVHVCLCV